MAREHRPDHRPLHPRGVLTDYAIIAIEDGPWPGQLALGPAPVGDSHPAAIAAWGATVVLGLTGPSEAAVLGRPDLAAHLASAGIDWLNAPIDDFTAPDERFDIAWPALRDELLRRLDAGGRVLVHCRAGRGRSGTVVAALLIAAGYTPAAAIAAVRRFRPGAIETAEQENWLNRQSPAG